MDVILYLDDDGIQDFKKKLKKLGKYKKDALTMTFFNYAFLKNSVEKWYKVKISILNKEE